MSHNRRRRPPRQQQLAEASDYDSEAFATDAGATSSLAQAGYTGTDSGATTHVPTRTNDEINLTVLKRHNPQIQQILAVAPFAVVYIFDGESGSWEKTGVEGTLFVSQLIPAVIKHGSNEGADGAEDDALVVERYSVTVLNRKGLNNFASELHTSTDVEVTDSYVILQKDEGQDRGIYGLWMYSEKGSSTEYTREVVASVMAECAVRSEQSRAKANEMFGEPAESIIENIAAQDTQEMLEGRTPEPIGQSAPTNGGYYGSVPCQHEAQQHHQQVQQQHQSGQQVDLLSLFGRSTAPNHPPPQQQYYQQPMNEHYQQHHQQQHPQQQHHHPQNGWNYPQSAQIAQPSYLPHGHPQQVSQPTQAQNLLSLFRSG